MQRTIEIKQQSWLGKAADMAMMPIMQVLSGSLTESPQRTHAWNNLKFQASADMMLQSELMVCVKGIPTAVSPWWFGFPLFHAPVLGGWKNFVVFEPWHMERPWHIGWEVGGLIGVTKVPTIGPLRMLIGPADTTFFGLDECGTQCLIRAIGTGRIGDGSVYQRLPLF